MPSIRPLAAVPVRVMPPVCGSLTAVMTSVVLLVTLSLKPWTSV